ncbi:MAG: hypothetical protein MK179_00605 [Pirellulaceae bacterium]|nr:hypothetical protein [Pirellulaceae bacterium]
MTVQKYLVYLAVIVITSCWSLHATVSAQELSLTPVALETPTVAEFPPGVLTVIPINSDMEETVSGPRELPDITRGIPDLDWQPNFSPKTRRLLDKAQSIILRRGIWNLEFAFKPVRMLNVDIPQPDGTMERNLVWYLAYRVTNRGHHLKPQTQQDPFGNETFKDGYINHSIRFFPNLVLVDQETKRAYIDQILPSAISAIARREGLGNRLHSSVSISRQDIVTSTATADRSVWGVATWIDVDPRIDFFSVFVTGLTNAYRYEEHAESFGSDQAPGTGRYFERKTLQLNFWRPGDAIDENEREIRYGLPGVADPVPEEVIFRLYDLTKRLDYQWIYR